MVIKLEGGMILAENGTLEAKDVYMVDGIIQFSKPTTDNMEVINVDGKLITPGLVDVHVHLREPGGEKKETIETGTQSAAAGGFTTIAAMPNTRPVPDTKEQMNWLQERIESTGHVRVLPYASITTRQLGKELTDFEALKAAGAFAFTDDGVGIQSADMMLQAMKKAKEVNMAIVAHCEENTLIHGGAVHEGKFSSAHNIPGIPSVCESVHIARDVLLAEATGCHYHVCHVSTKESVRVIRDAKKAGIHVTAEVSPHHLLLCEDDIPGLDTNYKMNPPLRAKEDQEALWEGLLDGTLDFIATDHAPHTEEEKAQGMERAPFGIVGLETAFPLLYTHLVKTEKATLKQLVDWLTIKPASTFNLQSGTLKEGAIADLTVIDLEEERAINKEAFLSKGKNTPFQGWTCAGWPEYTFVNGKLVFEKGMVTA
ncbi:dihydroorotase [Halalkalibacter wakoensis JCM 9140]|uniref:Dihydroorotase n=1 Tax=Halalkalibacter wakoensis JCM 9140 TaxID=1236970 RepID=W4PYI3_9BACI|nr:dihydroorotase [Halalkalibacter wakoensis]GAE24179.1 dihydroorotase [Halalkalibacter wakoensis JCM 9140]